MSPLVQAVVDMRTGRRYPWFTTAQQMQSMVRREDIETRADINILRLAPNGSRAGRVNARTKKRLKSQGWGHLSATLRVAIISVWRTRPW